MNKYRLEKVAPQRFQIIAEKDFVNLAACKSVHKGDLGGIVSSEDILSQEGTCWISNTTECWGNIIIRGDAYVSRMDISADGECIIEGKSVLCYDDELKRGHMNVSRDVQLRFS